jgi:hypothetical protein
MASINPTPNQRPEILSAARKLTADCGLDLGFWALAALYLLRHWRLLANNHLYPSHDNLGYHFPSFVNFANSLAHGFGFPRIIREWGGSEIAITSISMGYFAPHRLLGYLIYACTSAPPLLAYKLTLLLGFTVNAFGWHLLWKRTLPEPAYALFGSLLLFCSGLGITLFHQEQILMTLTWLPWGILFLLQAAETGRGLPLAAACAGCLMTLHYPQIHVVAFFLLALILSALRAVGQKFTFHRICRSSWVAAAATFLLAASPTFYILAKKAGYGSPLRGTQDFAAKSFNEYLEINRKQRSSAKPENLGNLARPETSNDDQMAFFMTRIGFYFSLIGLAGVFLFYREWSFLPFFVAVLAWATLGINGGLPQILYIMHFPTISLFRQWYHFSPYLIIALITLACLGLATVDQFASRFSLSSSMKFAVMAAITLVASGESLAYFKSYVGRYGSRFEQTIPRFTREEYLAALNRGPLRFLLPIRFSGSLVALKEDIAFFGRECPAALGPYAWALSSAPNEAMTRNWCALLKSARALTDGEVVFTPNSVQLHSLDASSRSIVLALNSELFDPATANVRTIPIAKKALTLTNFTGNGQIPYIGRTFLTTIACQYLTMFALISLPLLRKEAA